MKAKKTDTAPAQLTPAEWLVMQTVWHLTKNESEVTVAEILAEVKKRRAWHVSTLKTVMDRLVKKGRLASRIRGNTSFYKATASREGTVKKSIGVFLDRVLEGTFGPLVAYLAERKGLSDAEIEQLEKLLKENAKGGSE